MREIQIIKWCDICNSEDPPIRQEAVAEQVLDNRVLDLCEKHDEYVRGLHDALTYVFDLGSAVEKPKSTKKSRGEGMSTACPLCEYDGPTRMALQQHVKAKHNQTFTSLREGGYAI